MHPDANLTLILLALVGVVVPLATLLVKFLQDKRIATETRSQLSGIHNLVNSQLTEAVNRFNESLLVIEGLRNLLVILAPDDPRVRALTGTKARSSLPPPKG